MLTKLIYKVVEVIIKANYNLISLKLQAKNLFQDESKQTDLELLYIDYIEAVRNKEIFPQSKYKNHQIFIDYRKKCNGSLSQSEEAYLIKALDGHTSRWFVPYVLAVIDNFSEGLMVKLIETGIKVMDPSYCSSFIFPAKRVFDLKVNDYLIQRFPNANDREKGGILRLFYWVHSRISNVCYADGREEEKYVKDYHWDENEFKTVHCHEKEEFNSYKKLAIQKQEERIELLLNEYFITNKKRMRESIAWYLPNEIAAYPERLQKKAAKYLAEENSIF